MTLEIKVNLSIIDPLALNTAQDVVIPEREVWIDGKRVKSFLEKIILAGLDTMTAEYLQEVEKDMKEDIGKGIYVNGELNKFL